jgi:Family of unknown function (DUF6785)/Domain of unknown function (DUF6784)
LRGVTWRSVGLALLILPLNAYWLIQMEIVRYSAHPTTVSLLFNAVFILLVLTAANVLAIRLVPRHAFTQAELLTTYSIICAGSCIAGHDGIQVLTPMISWPFQYATPTNNWEILFWKHIPPWLSVRSDIVMRGYYEGSTNLYQWWILRAWARPVLAWGCFIVLLLLVMLAVNSALRRQWLDREHLMCPLVALPIEVTRPRSSLFTNHIFWIGFALTAGVDTWNSFAFHYPAMPRIPIEHQDLSIYFTARPWNAIGWTPRSFYPFMIGLGVLMPTDFLFSCWFFYLFWKVERVLSTALGWTDIPQFPFINEQAFGAYAMFCLYGLWTSRRFIGALLRRTIHGAGARSADLSEADAGLLDDSREPLPYRWAVALAVVGFIALVWFSVAAGMRGWVAVVFFVIYYGLALAITRMRAQFGAPVHDLHFVGPDTILPLAAGTRSFTDKDLTIFSLYFWFNRAYRNHPMPFQLEAFKLSDRTESPLRPQFLAQTIGIVAGTAAAFWAMLQLQYDYGAAAKSGSFGAEAFNRLASWLNVPTAPNWMSTGAVGVGLVFTFILETMRLRFANWPFHPLGFAISGSWEMNLVWMPLLIAWLLKVVLLRYGTFKLLRRMIPFFLGLILGQFVVGSILNIVSIAMGIPSYMFWQ